MESNWAGKETRSIRLTCPVGEPTLVEVISKQHTEIMGRLSIGRLVARDNDRARTAAASALGASVLAATGELQAPTNEYLGIILFVEPILMVNLCANGLIRAEGRAKTAMVTLIAGMLVNIGLDPLFIFGFGWGVRGAAPATIIGRTTSLVLIVYYFVSGRSSLRIRPRDLVPDPATLRQTLAIGSSGFVRQISTSAVYMVRNTLLVELGGGIIISAFGAVFRAMIFLGMPALGIAQALPPIAGYNYGARKYRPGTAGAVGVVAADPIAVTAGAVVAIVFLRNSVRKLAGPPGMVGR